MSEHTFEACPGCGCAVERTFEYEGADFGTYVGTKFRCGSRYTPSGALMERSDSCTRFAIAGDIRKLTAERDAALDLLREIHVSEPRHACPDGTTCLGCEWHASIHPRIEELIYRA